ncbi:glycoside hydrolase family 32 protein [Dyadobacter frigoris]|uniref:Glycoside hydrolase family 32 protein n=1 Tax=Dyadobacter frigoris TaxID=2576211 RepID=A0A4U6CSK9_9BACT|nr:glycoside hydrolase family 32 protein [Dyadobacter frigoris]TKT87610.1 glycoside hydrolase family 32 protein [Dyadobacter frigoris]GLU52671.1 hypothetical protein Dfri01_21320 [Dyadobacter frigoris]
MIKSIGIAAIALVTSCALYAQTSPKEQYRPAYHFTAPQNWINDPNGLVYLEGEYHIFYQHNPFGNVWGHMSWGHAVSKDLLHWQHLPVALEEYKNADDSTQTMIFSGGAVVDSANTSGFFEKGKKDGMVAIYTAHKHANLKGLAQYQNLAYSSDKGRSWKHYDKNPVLDIGLTDFRDPFVFWYAPGKKWIMSVVKALEYTVQFYESPNLKDWKLLSEFGRQGDVSKIWECSSLLQVPVQGQNQKKWMLMLSSGHRQKDYLAMQYFVGDFDGKNFIPQKQDEVLYIDEGKDFYAGIPFGNLQSKKPVMIGWINDWEYANKIPTEKFKGAMSVPRELSLKKTDAGYRLIQAPIELSFIDEKGIDLTNIKVKENLPLKYKGESYELKAEIEIGAAKTFGIKLLKSEGEESVLIYDAAQKRLSFDRTKSGNISFSDRFPSVESVVVKPQNGKITLQLLVDKSIVEIFANGGEQVMTDVVFPTKHEGGIELFSEGGSVVFKKLIIRTVVKKK